MVNPLQSVSADSFFGLDVRLDASERDVLRVRISGELDLATTPALERELEPLIAEARGRTVVLDVSGLSFLDSTGLRSLWTVRQQAQEAGGGLVLHAPSDPVMRVLKQTKLDRVFHVATPGVAS